MIINSFAAFDLEVEIAAQELFKIGDFSITNSFVTGLVGLLITMIVLVYVGQKVKQKKYNRFVGLIQWVFDGLLGQIDGIIPDKKVARKITPIAITIFFLVLFNYWLSVLPGLDSIKINHVPLMRSPTADLNFVLALAVISVITVQMYAVKHLGVFGNIHRYLKNPIKDPIGAFEGVLELVGEFSRGASLALRLFGNAFAGEVLLIVISLLTGYFASVTLPIFMAFELLVGFIQAYVFFVLTLIFTALAISHHDDAHETVHSPAVSHKKAHRVE